ncbi:hypothetical protein Tco_1044207 [Tanacetum coccineum]|uniref:Uncharacterized protein n=1 Tax=Tanacetum coccineum TaxID=301880 RepID=A0ABQ5GRG7_9ASTR
MSVATIEMKGLGPVWGCDRLVSRAKVIENQVVYLGFIYNVDLYITYACEGNRLHPFISIQSDSLKRECVTPEVGAVSVVSPSGVLDLVDYSPSSDFDPSEDSLPPAPDFPLGFTLFCSDDTEADDLHNQRYQWQPMKKHIDAWHRYSSQCWLKMITEAWKIRIHRYIRGKPMGQADMEINPEMDPTPHPMVNDPPPANLIQGLPRHSSTYSIRDKHCKEFWDNVEYAFARIKVGLFQQRKEDLFDEVRTLFVPLNEVHSGLLWAVLPQASISTHNNQLQTLPTPNTHATVHDGQIVSDRFRGRHQQRERRGVRCEAEASSLLRGEGPMLLSGLMAKLSYTSATNSQVNKVHSIDKSNLANVDYPQLNQDMHRKELFRLRG